MQMKLDDSGVVYVREYIENEEKCFLEETDTNLLLDDGLSYEKSKKLNPGPWDYITLLGEIYPKELECEDMQTNMHKTKEKKKKMKKTRLRMGEVLSRRSLTEAFLNIETLPEYTDDMFDIDDIIVPDRGYKESTPIDKSSFLMSSQYPQIPEELVLELGLTSVETNATRASCGGDSGYSDSPFSFTMGDEIVSPTIECQIEETLKTDLYYCVDKQDIQSIYLKIIFTRSVDPMDLSHRNIDNSEGIGNILNFNEKSHVPMSPKK